MNRRSTSSPHPAKRFAGTLKSTGEAIIAVDGDGRVTSANDPALEFLRTSREQLLGAVIWNQFPTMARRSVEAGLRRARDGEPCQAELLLSGLERGISIGFYPVPNGAMVCWHDITDQMELIHRLQADEEHLRLAQEGAGIGTWDWDLATGAIRWSPEMYRVLGIPEHETDLFAAWTRVLHPEDREVAAGNARAHSQTIGPSSHDFRVVRADGEVRWILSKGNTILGEDGRPVRMLGIDMDITERKRAEEALRASEERLNSVLSATRVGLWESDLLTGALTVSATCKANFGLPADAEFPLSVFKAAIHPDDWPRLEEAKDRAHLGHPYEVEYRNLWPNGTTHWIYSRATMVRDAAGSPLRMAGLSIDVTPLKSAEQAARDGEQRLLESQARLKVALQAAGLGTWETDMATGRNSWDSTMAAMLGFSPDEAPQARDRWSDLVHPEDRDRALKAFFAAARGGPPSTEELRIRRKDGRERTFVTSWVLAAPAMMVGAVQDVTEAREAASILARDKADLEQLIAERTAALAQAWEERNRAEEAARQSEKLAALGQLAGGIAHDFNNIVQAVAGAAGLIRRHASNEAQVERLAGMVEEAARRGASVTRRLLAFARRDELRAEAVPVAELMEGLREVLSHTLGASVVIATRVAPGLGSVLADRGQLETALVNLATNARDAMPDGGTLTLSAEAETVAAGDARVLMPGSYAKLGVVDTGAGMDPETLARACEPFFTTKPHGKGTGLGLAMARSFAEQSGGALHLASTPGQGTQVTVWLPRSGTEVRGSDAADSDSESGVVGSGGPRILLVDDEEMVRELLAAELADRGYEVVQAEGGDTALALLKTGVVIDLLVSDLSMPGMDGIALIRAIQERTPGVPAILLTGYAGEAASLAISGAVSGAFSLLRKPVSGIQLGDRVAALLEARTVS